jgi:hypothetical protein
LHALNATSNLRVTKTALKTSQRNANFRQIQGLGFRVVSLFHALNAKSTTLRVTEHCMKKFPKGMPTLDRFRV